MLLCAANLRDSEAARMDKRNSEQAQTRSTVPEPCHWTSVSASLFVALNSFNVLRPVTCYDCFFRYGVPFTFYREGGFVGGGGIVWAGLAGDIVVASTIGTFAVWLIARRRDRFRQGN